MVSTQNSLHVSTFTHTHVLLALLFPASLARLSLVFVVLTFTTPLIMNLTPFKYSAEAMASYAVDIAVWSFLCNEHFKLLGGAGESLQMPEGRIQYR